MDIDVSLMVERLPLADLVEYAGNAKKHPRDQVEAIKQSMREFGNCDPIAVWTNADGEPEIVEGHGRLMALRELGADYAPVIYLDHLTDDQRRAYVHVHNQTTLSSGFDADVLAAEIGSLPDFDWEAFGFDFEAERVAVDFGNLDAMTDGETDEYADMIDRHTPKKTTDDCYTPEAVYNAVRDWACAEYGIDQDKVVRPFYPGGDYERFDYSCGKVVIDNPPFSILAEIVGFYMDRGVPFLLFGPNLTIFSTANKGANFVICDSNITYENGVTVKTSFVTSLGDARIRTAPDLLRAVNDANESGKDAVKLDKYSYPQQVISAAYLNKIVRIPFEIMPSECEFVRSLDCQKDEGRAIFGGGFLISEAKAAEAKAAEAKAAEDRAHFVWELSDREIAIVDRLGGGESDG